MMIIAAWADDEAATATASPGAETGDLCIVVGYGRASGPLVGALRDEGLRSMGVEQYATAVNEIGRWQPELVLVGANEDAGALRSLLSRIRRASSESVVLYLADCQSKGRAVSAIEWGADDVVCPPHSVSAILIRQHLLRRFGARARGEGKASRRMSVGNLAVDLTTRQVVDGGQPFSLSGREFELLVCLMEANGEVVRREDLFMDIWGEEGRSEAALDATVHRLRRKLEARRSESELITTIRGIGYRLAVEALADADHTS